MKKLGTARGFHAATESENARGSIAAALAKGKRPPVPLNLSFQPLTPGRWGDFERLFGTSGACGGCWCMLWRLSRKQFDAQKYSGNRKAMRAIVRSGETPGILAYREKRAVGWCAVAPREAYTALERSRVLKPVDAERCWSVACLFVEKSFRKQSVATQLIQAAAAFARGRGAKWLEGYPIEPKGRKDVPAAFAWTGLAKSFQRAGFREVARRSPTRPIMRLEIKRG